MSTTITLHPAAKATTSGFVPMITLRGDKGRMIGARTPQGAYREFRTFATLDQAVSEARDIAKRVAAQYPGILQVRGTH